MRRSGCGRPTEFLVQQGVRTRARPFDNFSLTTAVGRSALEDNLRFPAMRFYWFESGRFKDARLLNGAPMRIGNKRGVFGTASCTGRGCQEGGPPIGGFSIVGTAIPPPASYFSKDAPTVAYS